MLLAGGGELPADAVVVATGGATAAALLPGLAMPDTRTVTTVYHVAPASPLGEPTLLVNTEGEILNTCVLTDVSPGYGTGRALVSTSVLGGGGGDREPAIRARLAEMYQTDTAGWEHLASYTIDGALPAMLPAAARLPAGPEHGRRVCPGRAARAAGGTGAGGPRRYVCGDHRATGSVQGALASGARAAREILADG